MNDSINNFTDENNFNSSVDLNVHEDYFKLNLTFNWFFLIFLTIIVIGTFMNAVFIITLISSRKNGKF